MYSEEIYIMTKEYVVLIRGNSIGENIKILRQEKGLSQTQLAEKLDVSKSIISAYEKNIRKPSLNTLFKMSEIFEVSVAELMSPDNFIPTYESTEPVDISKLTPQQKIIIKEMIKGFEKENKLNKKD